MGVPDNNIDGLERQRLELERNILQLQQSLYHWRTWEAEYEGLKENFDYLDDDSTADDFLRVSRDFGGSFVTEDEFRVITGEKQGLRRSKLQVINLLSRRVDYVRDNIATMEKRLRAAESQMGDLDVAESQPPEPTGEFPMREIIEELDEDGGIISGATTTPGNQASSLLDILKKAGVKDILDLPPQNSAPTESSGPTIQDTTPKIEEVEHKQEDSPDLGSGPGLSGGQDVSQDVSQSASDVVNVSDKTEKEAPVVDVDESPEDAQLRREMLKYGLDEVGAVVAELELDDGASDVSFDDGYDSYTYDNEEDEDEEDEYGRNVRPILNEGYHQQMRELEAKLNARGMWNVGKDSASLPSDVKTDIEQPGRVKIEEPAESNGDSTAKAKPKKKVAFADDFDIAPASQPSASKDKESAPRETQAPVLSDSIVERKPAEEGPGTAEAPAPKKASRFKTARGMAGTIDANSTASGSGSQLSKSASQRKQASLAPTPSMPLFPARPAEPKPFSKPISDISEKAPNPSDAKGKILADTLIERDVSRGTATAPEPDELDEELHRKEIATEFHQMKNKMAKENGGSLDEEPEMVPVETEEPPKRISKFRASRMV